MADLAHRLLAAEEMATLGAKAQGISVLDPYGNPRTVADVQDGQWTFATVYPRESPATLASKGWMLNLDSFTTAGFLFGILVEKHGLHMAKVRVNWAQVEHRTEDDWPRTVALAVAADWEV